MVLLRACVQCEHPLWRSHKRSHRAFQARGEASLWRASLGWDDRLKAPWEEALVWFEAGEYNQMGQFLTLPNGGKIVLVFHEYLTLMSFCGILCIIAAIIVLNYRSAQRKD